MIVVTCDNDAPQLSAQVVVAQRDGVHIMVPASQSFSGVFVRNESGGGNGENLSPGAQTRLVLDVPPGDASVACSSRDGLTSFARFRITDPDGVYAASDLDCDVSAALGTGDSRGQTPLAAALLAFTPLSPSEGQIEIAGYKSGTTRHAILAVEDDVIAAVTVVQSTEGGEWTADGAIACESALPDA